MGGVRGWGGLGGEPEFVINVSAFRIERLSAKIKLTFHKALIDLLITYVHFALEISVDSCCFFNTESPSKKVLRSIGNSPRDTTFFFVIGMLLYKFCTSMISLQIYAINKQKSYEMASVIRHGVAQPRKYEVRLLTVQVCVVLISCKYNEEYFVLTSPGLSEASGVF